MLLGRHERRSVHIDMNEGAFSRHERRSVVQLRAENVSTNHFSTKYLHI
jgi:hypothetical protein